MLPAATGDVGGTLFDAGTRLSGTTSCGQGTGLQEPAQAYQVTLPQGGRFKATVVPTDDAGFTPSVHVASSCTTQVLNGFKGCAQGGGAGPTTVLLNAIDAGTYVVVVTGTDGTAGSYRLITERIDTPVDGTATSCANPGALTLTNGSVEVTSHTAGAGDDLLLKNEYNLACSSTGSPDRVYSVTVPSGALSYDVTASVWSLNGTEGRPALGIFKDTCGADAGYVYCVGMNGGYTPRAEAARFTFQAASATNLYFVVDNSAQSYLGGQLPFTLRVDVAPRLSAPNDFCNNATPLSANTTYASTTLGSGSDYFEYPSPCNVNALYPPEGPDVAYTYTPTASGMAKVTVNPELGFDVAVQVMSDCNATSCFAQSDSKTRGGPETITFAVTQGVTYRIIVDGVGPANSNTGRFSISVQQ